MMCFRESLYKAASAMQEMVGDIKQLGEELELLRAGTAVKVQLSIDIINL